MLQGTVVPDMSQLRELVSGLSLWNPVFNYKSVREGSVMVKVALG